MKNPQISMLLYKAIADSLEAPTSNPVKEIKSSLGQETICILELGSTQHV
jgi:hypothetical protein